MDWEVLYCTELQRDVTDAPSTSAPHVRPGASGSASPKHVRKYTYVNRIFELVRVRANVCVFACENSSPSNPGVTQQAYH